MPADVRELIYLLIISFETVFLIFAIILAAGDGSQCSYCNDCVHYCKRKHSFVASNDSCRKVCDRR